MTPLHVAAKSGRFEVVEFLAGKGGDISTTDNNGVSIMWICLLINEDYITDWAGYFKMGFKYSGFALC